MPNTINRIRTSHLLKLEKEYENTDIRRKERVVGGAKAVESLKSKHESGRSRIIRLRKAPSNDSVLPESTMRSTTQLSPTAQPAQRRARAATTPQLYTRKKLTNSSSPSPRYKLANSSYKLLPAEKRLPKKPVKSDPPLVEPEIISYTMVSSPMKSMDEILTARSICSSSSPESGNWSPRMPMAPIALPVIDSDDMLCGWSEHDSDLYVTAPLRQVPTTDSISGVAQRLCNVLNKKNRSIEPEEVDTIKRVVKSDERYRGSNPKDDAQLFKDILRSQLQAILKQELVVTSVLTKLDSKANLNNDNTSTNGSTSGGSGNVSPTGSERPKVDVIFKNVPTIEKEIIILKALGEKLEATLRRSSALPPDFDAKLKSGRRETFVKVDVIQSKSFFEVQGDEFNATITVRSRGVKSEMGLVREFRMAQKTIVELREHANKHFYLPLEGDISELKRTCFKRLKENPDVFLRHLRPKKSSVPFNILEQDPIFFNNLLFNQGPTSPRLAVESCSDNSASSGPETARYRKTPTASGASSMLAEQSKIDTLPLPPTPIASCCETVVPPSEGEQTIKADKPAAVIEVALVLPAPTLHPPAEELPIERGTMLLSWAKRSTARPATRANKKYSPKRDYFASAKLANGPMDTFKTILVGSVQLCVFLTMIMALAYPDIKC